MITIDITHSQFITLRMALSDAIHDYKRQAAWTKADPQDLYPEYMAGLAKQCEEILEAVAQATETPEEPSAPVYQDDFSNEGACEDGCFVIDGEVVRC